MRHRRGEPRTGAHRWRAGDCDELFLL